jgi:aspartokinase-like uncharacterized kinase
MSTVVKVGGSLAAYPEKLRSLCVKLSEISKKQKLLIVPGGGEFADTVRKHDEIACCVAQDGDFRHGSVWLVAF